MPGGILYGEKFRKGNRGHDEHDMTCSHTRSHSLFSLLSYN